MITCTRKGSNGRPNLDTYLKNERTCYLDVCKVNISKEYSNHVTGYMISGITDVFFIVLLQYISGGRSHIIGINRELIVIYDCIEKHELQLNHENLSKCCGPNCVFEIFYIEAEFSENRIHVTPPKDEITIDDLYKKYIIGHFSSYIQ